MVPIICQRRRDTTKAEYRKVLHRKLSLSGAENAASAIDDLKTADQIKINCSKKKMEWIDEMSG